MSSGLSLLNADCQITIVQNNVDQLKNLTISSVSDLQNQLDYSFLDSLLILYMYLI